RQARIEAPGILYHVIARGIERKEIFRDPDDYEFFLSRLGRVLVDTETKCLAFCLMPNHIHLLIRSGRIPVSTVMRRLLTGYAVCFNRKYDRVGHLFQNRYKSIICQEESYLLTLIRYIHLNPKRAGLVSGTEGLDSYLYAGHRALIGREKLHWYDTALALSCFSGNVARAKDVYLDFLGAAADADEKQVLEGGGKIRSLGFLEALPGEPPVFDERILGDSDFVRSLTTLSAEPIDVIQTHPDEIMDKVGKRYGLSVEQIKGQGKSGDLNEARALIAYLAVVRLGMSFAATAGIMNLHRSTVARLINKGREVAAGMPVNKWLTR
ncbi:MAG: transposase, partial [Actinomycetota bacterium]|nr:transposase [Actinomycetota bacterium]